MNNRQTTEWTDAMAAITQTQREVDHTRALYRQALARRVQAVRAAHELGASISHLSRLLGIQRTAVYKDLAKETDNTTPVLAPVV